MASHWMREVKFTEVSGGSIRDNAAKFIYLFLRYVLGYTHVSESAASGRSFQTYEKTGTAGSFTGSSFRFTDSTASSFVVGDVNKWILIADMTNPENSGWYQIVAYVDADNVDINFKTGITEYPTLSSGLTWYVMAEDYDIPITNDDYWRLRTPHVDGWEVECRFFDFYVSGDYRVFQVRVSLDQDWTSSGKILGPAAGCWGIKTNTALGSTIQYVEGDTDGSYVHFINLASASSFMGEMCSIVPVTPIEDTPAHAAEEKIALMGAIEGAGANYNGFATVENVITRRNAAYAASTSDGYHWGNLAVWRNSGARQCLGGLIFMSWNSVQYSFTGLPARQLNSRRGGSDTLLGSPAVIDYQNEHNHYEITTVGGHQTVRANLPGMQVIDQSGTKNKIHVSGGILLPWPGFTPTFTG